ncbi:uncharacterized protein [Engystomops pustulosus]
MTSVAKVQNASVMRRSPYMKRISANPATHKSSPSPLPGARKSKTPPVPPSTGCTSAPAASTRSPAGGAPALHPPLKAKRGASSVSVGGVRARHSAPVIQREAQVKGGAPYQLIPVRLKRTGLKLLDPEKVKNLTSAARLPMSGNMKRNFILHETTINKQPHWSRRQSTAPGSSVSEAAGKKTGGTSRRDHNVQAGGQKSPAPEDPPGDLPLTDQINALLLDDKGSDESGSCGADQVCNGHPQAGQPGVHPHDTRPSVQDNAGHSEEAIIQDDLTDLHTTSEETADPNRLVTTSGHSQIGDGQEKLPGDTESSSQEKETTNQRQSPTAITEPPCPEVSVMDGLCTTSTEAARHSSHLQDPNTRDHDVQPPVGEESAESNTDDDLLGEKILGTNLLPEEQKATEKQRVWSRSNEVIRQSQGVLVLTRSTDESAVFIPKLRFEFTPDNSVDWTMHVPPPPGSQRGAPAKRNEPRDLQACTPRGPSFSKSVLRKSCMLPGPGGSSVSAQSLSITGDVTRKSSRPMDRIVDLSISFQGKFEAQEIPADIPKILLTEEDHDED